MEFVKEPSRVIAQGLHISHNCATLLGATIAEAKSLVGTSLANTAFSEHHPESAKSVYGLSIGYYAFRISMARGPIRFLLKEVLSI